MTAHDGPSAAEIVEFCLQGHWESATAALEASTISPTVILTVLQHAIQNDHESIVALALRHFPGSSLNSPNQKDGKTLLHTAVAKKNLKIIRLLLDAGASLDAPDKRVATPLQDVIFKLQQRTALLEKETLRLQALTRLTNDQTERLGLDINETQVKVASEITYRRSIANRIEATKSQVEATQQNISQEIPKLDNLKEEIRKTRMAKATMIAQLDGMEESAESALIESERLREVHKQQLGDLLVIDQQTSVKCETIMMMRCFVGNERLQTLFVGSLKIMCQRLENLRKLVMGGVQSHVLLTMRAHSANLELQRRCIEAITFLSQRINAHRDDGIIRSNTSKWPTVELVESLMQSQLAITRDVEFVTMLEAVLGLLAQFGSTPEQQDVTGDELPRLIVEACKALSGAAQTHLPASEAHIRHLFKMQSALGSQLQQAIHTNTTGTSIV